MSDKELDEIDTNLKRSQVEGVHNILKYFDRIHDKLFTFKIYLLGNISLYLKFMIRFHYLE